MSRGSDEVGTRGNGTFHQRVSVGFRGCADAEKTFVVAGWRDLAVADGPPEPATRDQDHPNTGVDDELQRLRDTIVGRFPRASRPSARR
jgi:hypothetical protein